MDSEKLGRYITNGGFSLFALLLFFFPFVVLYIARDFVVALGKTGNWTFEAYLLCSIVLASWILAAFLSRFSSGRITNLIFRGLLGALFIGTLAMLCYMLATAFNGGLGFVRLLVVIVVIMAAAYGIEKAIRIWPGFLPLVCIFPIVIAFALDITFHRTFNEVEQKQRIETCEAKAATSRQERAEVEKEHAEKAAAAAIKKEPIEPLLPYIEPKPCTGSIGGWEISGYLLIVLICVFVLMRFKSYFRLAPQMAKEKADE